MVYFKVAKLIRNIADAITIAAIDSPFPLPFLLFDLERPIPPNIQPSKGIKKEHTKPATAIPFF